MSTVHFGRKSRNSGLALQEALNNAGYTGPDINYGLGHSNDALNKPEALRMAVNKRLALEAMAQADVPIPTMYVANAGDANAAALSFVTNGDQSIYPLVGRPDHHSKGRGFWLCRTLQDVQRALRGTSIKQAATHFLQYIDNAREFRVHVVRDGREGYTNKYRTIKISEKIKDVNVEDVEGRRPITGNHANGIVFNYTDVSNRDRKSLRKAAREAVMVLNLDFGAVDILFKDNKPYVLEVNTAPRLTDETSDTLDKYVQAFMRYWNE